MKVFFRNCAFDNAPKFSLPNSRSQTFFLLFIFRNITLVQEAPILTRRNMLEPKNHTEKKMMIILQNSHEMLVLCMYN